MRVTSRSGSAICWRQVAQTIFDLAEVMVLMVTRRREPRCSTSSADSQRFLVRLTVSTLYGETRMATLGIAEGCDRLTALRFSDDS